MLPRAGRKLRESRQNRRKSPLKPIDFKFYSFHENFNPQNRIIDLIVCWTSKIESLFLDPFELNHHALSTRRRLSLWRIALAGSMASRDKGVQEQVSLPRRITEAWLATSLSENRQTKQHPQPSYEFPLKQFCGYFRGFHGTLAIWPEPLHGFNALNQSGRVREWLISKPR